MCVCAHAPSCSSVCLVQNWFKAPGHRKKAAQHSRHVPETSSRGSTVAIHQCRLQTPKWVGSVLQCPAWQFATYSAPLALNLSATPPPTPATSPFSLPVHLILSLPHSFSHACVSIFILAVFLVTHFLHVYAFHHSVTFFLFSYTHIISSRVAMFWLDTDLLGPGRWGYNR